MTTIAGANVAVDEPEVEGALLAFARSLRARHVRGAVLAALLRSLLAVAVPCIVIGWLVPEWRAQVLAVVAALSLVAGLLATFRARRLAAQVLLTVAADADGDVPRDDVRLRELQDELATWLEHHRDAATPMRQWLARDVHVRIGRLAPAAIADVGRRRLGRLLWLLPLVLLLLIAWFLTDLLSPPWAGVLGGAQNTPRSGGGDGSGEGNGAGGGNGDQPEQHKPDEQPQQPEPRDRPQPPDQKPPPPPPQSDNPDSHPEEPAPLLELPPQQRFVVPEFIGDGPTRRARMHVAAADDPEGGAARTEQRGDAPADTPPPPARADFERAAEAAQRARHVPPAERPMVRRFFDALREAAK